MELKQATDLDYSDIVANSSMNRKRKATGVNSYEKDLYFNPINYLESRLNQVNTVNWLDVCCGEGNALIETAVHFSKSHPKALIELEGVDLVDFYSLIPMNIPNLKFHTSPIRNFHPQKKYDLITCVHGLHYLGNKLATVIQLISWLRPEGKFIANLDLHTILNEEGNSLQPAILKHWKRPEININYNKKRKIVTRNGFLDIPFDKPVVFLGADDKAGPNYTGQRGVSSYYRGF